MITIGKWSSLEVKANGNRKLYKYYLFIILKTGGKLGMYLYNAQQEIHLNKFVSRSRLGSN